MFEFSKDDMGTQNVPIFNNGQAGVAKEVKVYAQKIGVDYEDGPNVPHYKITFEDESGKVDTGFYYLVKETFQPTYGTYDEAVRKQWRKVGSILEAAGVSSAGNFSSAEHMLDSLMSKINSATKDKTFNVFCNYGHSNSPRKYLQIRSWLPFIEASNVEKSALKVTNIDQMERLTPDDNINTTDSAGWGV